MVDSSVGFSSDVVEGVNTMGSGCSGEDGSDGIEALEAGSNASLSICDSKSSTLKASQRRGEEERRASFRSKHLLCLDPLLDGM